MDRTNGRLERANRDLMNWASWSISHLETSCIGYPARTAEGRAMEEGTGVQQGKATSRCPDVMMPPHIHHTDQAIKEMPGFYRIAVLCKYYPERAETDAKLEIRHTGKWTGDDQMRLFKRITGRKRYHDYCRIGVAWIAGGIR